MSAVIRSVTAEVFVESGVFAVQDVDTAAMPAPWPQELPEPGFGLFARPNRLDVESGMRDGIVVVTLESCDGAPPERTDEDGDVDVDHDELTLSSGTVRLWELTGGGSAATLVVGDPGRYAVRCTTTGQSAAAVLVATGEAVPDGAVAYSISFWPAA